MRLDSAETTPDTVLLIGYVQSSYGRANRQKYCSRRACFRRRAAELDRARVVFPELRATLQEWQTNRLAAAFVRRRRLSHYQRRGMLQPSHIPMRRHIAEPWDAGWLVGGIGVVIGHYVVISNR